MRFELICVRKVFPEYESYGVVVIERSFDYSPWCSLLEAVILDSILNVYITAGRLVREQSNSIDIQYVSTRQA